MQIGGMYTIDFARVSKIPKFEVTIKNGDSKRTIKLILLKNSEVLNLNNYTVVVAAKKIDGKDIFNTVRTIDAEAGICEVEISEQMLALDMDLPCEIVVYNSDGVVASSSNFVISKISSLKNEESIVSSNEFTALTKALSDVTYIKSNLVKKRDKNIKINKDDLDISHDDKKIKLINLSQEVHNALSGNASVSPEIPNEGITNEKYANGSITKSKLHSSIHIAPTHFIQKVIHNPNDHLKSLPLTYNGIAKRLTPASFMDADYSIEYKPTEGYNYVWLADFEKNSIPPTEFELVNIGNTMTFSFIYSYSGSGYLPLKGRVYYEDGSSKSVDYGKIIPPGNKKVFTYEIHEENTIKSFYVYTECEMDTILEFTSSTLYYGEASSDMPYRLGIAEKLDDVYTKTNFNNKIIDNLIKYKNWYKYTDGVNNGTAQSIPTTNGVSDWNSLGNVQLDIANSVGLNNWIGYSKKTALATPFIQIKIDDDMVSRLDKMHKSGDYLDDAYVEIDIVIEHPEAIDIDVQPIGRTSSWIYFKNYKINHAGGKVKYTRKMFIESSYLNGLNFSDLQFLSIYILFKKSFTDGKFYVSNITNCYDKHINNDLVEVGSKNIKMESVNLEHLSPTLQNVLNNDSSPNLLNKDLKIAYVGDSVTWGDGGLNDGYIGFIDKVIRSKFMKSIFIDDLFITGSSKVINSPKFYDGKALRLSGVGSDITFSMVSDQLHLCLAKDRKNIDSSICELYVDGKLIDTFSTYNESRHGSKTKTFNSDGVQRKFQLGEAFTYNHVIKLNGNILTGNLNTAGYGAEFPTGHDYMIIRAYDGDKVKHTLFFKTPPTQGTIEATFDYGESITYAKTTVGEVGDRLESGIESYYGDGNVAFDPANAVSLSSGLDFRKVNHESFRSYNFAENKLREFKIKIKSLDSRITSVEVPSIVFNFATAGKYEYMNAGIGGFQYNMFNKETGLTSYRKFMEYEPDIITVLLGTNDDWGKAEYPIYQPRTVEASFLDENSYYWINGKPSKSGSNFNINDRWVNIKSFDEYTITLDDAVIVDGTISKNDIIIINKWGNDERYCQVRLIGEYDLETKTIKFNTPIDISKITLETQIYVKSLNKLGADIDSFIEKVRSYDQINPDIYISCMGVPNMNHRQLLGYREYLRYISRKHNVKFIDLFTPTSEYQGTVERIKSYTITSTGASEYLVDASLNPLLRNVVVEVDGVNIFDGNNVRLCGGYGYYWNHDLTNGYKTTPTVIKFKNPPEYGKSITIKGTIERYSSDYCHMGNSSGKYIYGNTIINTIL